ncbi:MAG: hypothetical protein Q9M40_13655 [Sulfurimonas sp.]|nr:hypothetical protein [Sulfurimonas sp.]
MIYEQKYRLGEVFSMPILHAAMIEMRKKNHYIYLNDDGRYYDEKGHEVEGFYSLALFAMLEYLHTLLNVGTTQFYTNGKHT